MLKFSDTEHNQRRLVKKIKGKNICWESMLMKSN